MVNMVSRSMNGLFTDLCVTVVLSWISHKIAYSFPVPQPKCIESHAFWRNIFIFIEHTNFSRGMLSSILPLKKYIVKLTKIRILLQKLFQIVMSYDIILSMYHSDLECLGTFGNWFWDLIVGNRSIMLRFLSAMAIFCFKKLSKAKKANEGQQRPTKASKVQNFKFPM